jgi:hypothetical protein
MLIAIAGVSILTTTILVLDGFYDNKEEKRGNKTK